MKRSPNILFLIADDHRFDCFGAAGNPTVQTPTLDALAERGVMFRRAHMLGETLRRAGYHTHHVGK